MCRTWGTAHTKICTVRLTAFMPEPSKNLLMIHYGMDYGCTPSNILFEADWALIGHFEITDCGIQQLTR